MNPRHSCKDEERDEVADLEEEDKDEEEDVGEEEEGAAIYL